MSAIRKFPPRRSAVLTIAALMISACAYGPVVVDDYADASNYRELIAQAESDQKLQNAIDKNVLRVARSDGPVQNWSSGGDDIDSLIAASPGGKQNTVLVALRGNELWVSSYRGFGDEFGSDFTEYPVFGPSAGFNQPQNNRLFNLSQVGEGVWLETIRIERKIGHAKCSNSGSEAARLFSNRPFESLSRLEKSTLVAYVAGAKRKDIEVCAIYTARDGNLLDGRFFLPNGQSLPVFNREVPQYKLRPRSEIVAKLR